MVAKKPGEATEFARRDPKNVQVGTGATAQGSDKADDQSIKVRALRTFHKEENMQGEMVKPGDEFDCPRGRAAQLRANGLIEYVNEADGARIHGDETNQKLTEQQQRDSEMREVPDKHKGTPLRNPELKLADAPDESQAGKK